MRGAKSHWFAFATGLAVLTVAMNAEALAVWQGFGRAHVLLAELGLLAPAAALTLLGFPRLRSANLRLPRLSVPALIRQGIAGSAFGVVAFLACFAPVTIYGAYYQAFPMAALDAGLRYHQDTAFHTALIQSILNFGFPSTAQHLTPLTFYYTLSHYTDALASLISGIAPFAATGLLFHFKKLIALVAIAVFLARATAGRSALFRAVSVVLMLPAFIGTWTLIGSEGLWTASIILLAIAPRVWKLLKDGNPTTRSYLYLTAVLLVLGVAKFASGLMLALLIGLWLVQLRARSAKFWLFGGIWLAMYSALAYLFSLSNTTASVPTSLANAISYWTVRGADRSAPSLVALYVILGVSVVLWLRWRTAEAKRFVVTQLGALLVLGALASHFAKTDEFYFTYGVLFVVLTLAIQLAAEQLRVAFRKPFSVAVAILVIAATAAIPQTSLSAFGTSKHDLISAVHKADNAYLADLNRITSKHTSVTKLLRGAHLPKAKPGVATKFVNSLHAFENEHSLTSKNAVLWVPKHIFLTQTNFMVGKWWAKGLLMYAITGVPLVHGSPTLWLGYGYANYTAADLWTNDASSLEPVLTGGKNVIVVKDLQQPRFELLTAAGR